MSIAQTAAAIAVMAVVTFLTRALPFFLFDRGEKPPRVVLYLGKYLPAGVIAMLIVYCLKGVGFETTAQWLPSLLACGAVVGLCWPAGLWWGCTCGSATICSPSWGAPSSIWCWCRWYFKRFLAGRGESPGEEGLAFFCLSGDNQRPWWGRSAGVDF